MWRIVKSKNCNFSRFSSAVPFKNHEIIIESDTKSELISASLFRGRTNGFTIICHRSNIIVHTTIQTTIYNLTFISSFALQIQPTSRVQDDNHNPKYYDNNYNIEIGTPNTFNRFLATICKISKNIIPKVHLIVFTKKEFAIDDHFGNWLSSDHDASFY